MDSKELYNLIASEDSNAAIAELKNGRNTTEPKTEEYVKQLDPTLHDVCDPVKRRDKIVKVDVENETSENLKNIMATPGYDSETNTRPEPVARIALAIQKLIVKRAVAFTFGNAVGLTSDPTKGTKEADVLKAVKRVLFETKSRTLNRKVARAIFSSTEAAELWYPVEKPNESYGFSSKHKLRVAIFSPMFGDKLYPYFDETGDMIAFSREYVVKNDKGVKTNYFETYTENEHIIWVGTKGMWQVVEGYPKPNQIKKIPVIYGQQPAVEWEDVQGLIDRLEKLLSNFADTNDYHASPKIFTTGTILGFAKKGESGAIIEGDEGATAQYLAWQNAPESVKLEIETLLRLIYTITQTPDISFDSVKGIGAVSGIALKLLFMDAHLKVQDKCEIFDDYLQRRINIIQAFLAEMNKKDKSFADGCKSLIIEPEIVPYMIEDEQAKVDLLKSANGNKPVASQKATIQQLGWAKDTKAEYEQIQAETIANSYTGVMEPTF